MPENEIKFMSAGIEFAGTLALPDSAGPYPAVLLLPGSGQTDRDDNVKKKFRINTLAEIAHDLQAHGFASLRYDKRGVGMSGGDYWSAGLYDRFEDSRAALRFLKEHPDIQSDKVFALGHSEGAMLSARLAGTGEDVAGVVLLAGSAQTGEEILHYQIRQVTPGLKGLNAWIIRLFRIDVGRAQQKQLDKIKRSTKDCIRHQFIVKVNAKWLREFIAYDPTLDLSNIHVPVLAITGSKDIQVDPADLARMEQLIKAPFEGHVIPDLTHLLRLETGEAAISRYKAEVKRPTEPQVLEIIRHWLENRVAAGTAA